jgi:hypothetical protein
MKIFKFISDIFTAFAEARTQAAIRRYKDHRGSWE